MSESQKEEKELSQEEKQEEKEEKTDKESPSEEKVDEKVNDQIKPEEKKFTQNDFDKNSFCSRPIFNKSKTFQAPFPITLTKHQLTYKYNPDYLKEFLIKDYYGVYCLNQEIVDRQSGVIKDLIIQLTKSILSRTHITISLPIRIFEPRSMI